MPLVRGGSSSTRPWVELVFQAAAAECGLGASGEARNARQVLRLGEGVRHVRLKAIGEAPPRLDQQTVVPLLAERPQDADGPEIRIQTREVDVPRHTSSRARDTGRKWDGEGRAV